MKKLAMLATALLLVAAGAAAFEHGPRRSRMRGGMHGGPGMHSEHHFERLAEKLELTAAQREAAEKLHENARAQAEAQHEKMRAAHEAMEEIFDSASPDPTALGQRLLEARAARQELEALHEAAMAEFKKLLDAEQLAELEALHSERSRMRTRHGASFPHDSD